MNDSELGHVSTTLIGYIGIIGYKLGLNRG